MIIEELSCRYSPLHRSKNNSSSNEKMVSLIKDKLIPLNRNKYEHLKKINRAHKQQPNQLQTTEAKNYYTTPPITQRRKKDVKVGGQSQTKISLEADILLERLKGLNNQNKGHKIQHQSEVSFQHLKCLQKEEPQSQFEQIWRTQKLGVRKKEPLLKMVMRAQRHLMIKKRELGDRISERDEKNNAIVYETKGTKVRKRGKVRQSQDTLQSDLLRDIRLTFLQQKMNRWKRNINHQKIVQMR